MCALCVSQILCFSKIKPIIDIKTTSILIKRFPKIKDIGIKKINRFNIFGKFINCALNFIKILQGYVKIQSNDLQKKGNGQSAAKPGNGKGSETRR